MTTQTTPASAPVTGWSARAEATTRRTYNRPTDAAGETFETWDDTIQRAQVDHHIKLWSDAGGEVESPEVKAELAETKQLGLSRAGLVSGRTLWLGGTKYGQDRACSNFNCSAMELTTVFDMVDAFWLLLNGSGVGALPRVGTLHGYRKPMPLSIIPSERDKDWKGNPENTEVLPSHDNGYTWWITIGDSAEAWAKAAGKMLVSPHGRCDRLVIDGSNCRGPGGRLKGYGWICNGFPPLAEALTAIHGILNRRAGDLLTEDDIGDVFNWAGSVLSSRRSAQILLMDEHNPGTHEFATRKHEYWRHNPQRRQSNNSLLFWRKPSLDELSDLLKLNLVGGEPGFINAAAALRKAPWFRTCNPCAEILLSTHSFCNLCSICLPMFGHDYAALERATYLMARANYRQTCVDLRDGVLQPRWHQTNESLRLCGVSFTGIVNADWLSDYHIRRLRNAAVSGAYSMADELGLPRPKAVTTIKPEGTRSKISGRPSLEPGEGMHRPMVGALAAAGYATLPNPSDPHNVLVRFPVDYAGCKFSTIRGMDGLDKDVNLEPATSQLARYLRWNRLWADHNVSATISFDAAEIPALAKMISDNWDSGYIATAFLARHDASKTAADLGHPYLPQEVVSYGAYQEATAKTRPVDWARFHKGIHEISDPSGECPSGMCPVR